MGYIDDIMQSEPAIRIQNEIETLPKRARFRAYNSVRFLNWANAIYERQLFIPACFCSLHATEEAVAAFVSCAKECGYGDDAKLNIKDHQAKATVSLLVEKISRILLDYELHVAPSPNNRLLAVRYVVDGELTYNDASTKLFHFVNEEKCVEPDFFGAFSELFENTEDLKRSVEAIQEARNKIFYATSTGLPSGYVEPENALRRESQISLGLIWAAIDMKRHEGDQIPFIQQALRTANIVLKELKKKSS